MSKQESIILCYHDIDKSNDMYAVTYKMFKKHMKYLKDEGYKFLTLDEYVKFAHGELELPEKNVMITFDDGLRSFYTKAYPVLKEMNIPATLGIVSSWIYGENKESDIRAVMTWDEVREVDKDPLIDVVSHTHNMHYQDTIDSFGDTMGTAGHLLYKNGRYETEEEYKARLDADMKATQDSFQKELGRKATAMIWPYGDNSGVSIRSAQEHGMMTTFNFSGGVNVPGELAWLSANRICISDETDLKRLKEYMTTDHDAWNSHDIRMAQVDIDALYVDPEDDDEERSDFQYNIERMVDVVTSNGINVVALQTFCDDDGDGDVSEVYYNSSILPIKEDVFNHIAAALHAENIAVVGWLPGLCYTPLALPDGSNLIGTSDVEESWYHRVSPFCEDNVKKLEIIYRDLSKYTLCDGILFQDDMYMTDWEDASEWGKAAYKKEFGKEYEPPKDGGETGETITPWALFKTKTLTNLALRLASAFKEYVPRAIVMRDIYSTIMLEPGSQEWFCQNFDDCIEHFDYTVIMAYPYMDHEEPVSFLTNLCNYVKERGDIANEKSIMKIQTIDWDYDCSLGQEIFQWQIKLIRDQGIKHIGYYPHTECQWEPNTEDENR